MTTKPDLDQAREWAKSNLDKGHFAYGGRVMAAAHVIASLPDEWIDAGKLRELVEAWGQRFITSDADRLLRDLRALLPQPRTLADTKWDDNVHPYMEAVTVSGRRHILLAPMGDTAVSGNTILVAEHDGGMPVLVPAEYLFPTGRYARLSLPEEQATDEDVSIIPPEIDTSTGHDDDVDMTPEDVSGGHYLVRWWGEEHPVPAEKVWGQWWVVGLASILPAKDILIVSRLVPEVEQATEETPDQPRPEDVPAGELWLVEADGQQCAAVRERPWEKKSWWLMRGYRVSDKEITLVSRLVPEKGQA